MKRTLPDGKTVQRFHAIFDGDTQITRWDTRKDKVFSAFKHRGQRVGPHQFMVRSQWFVSPAKEQKEAA